MAKGKAIWFSRHDLTEKQKEGLKRILKSDKVEVKVVNKTVQSAREIVEEITDEKLIAVVLPVGLLSELKKLVSDDIIIAVPRNKRVRENSGEFVFVYDGWEIVKICIYESEIIY